MSKRIKEPCLICGTQISGTISGFLWFKSLKIGKYCGNCRTELYSNCQNCNKKLFSISKYCPHCNQDIYPNSKSKELVNKEIENLKADIEKYEHHINSNNQEIKKLENEKLQITSEKDIKISSLAKENDNLSNRLNQLIFESNQHKNRISTLENIKIENERKINKLEDDNRNLNTKIEENRKLLEQHKRNKSIIEQFQKENSDLLVFYEELIKVMVLLNPIRNQIIDFSENLNRIQHYSDKKQISVIIGDCISKLDFSNIENDLKEFIQGVISLLHYPLENSTEILQRNFPNLKYTIDLNKYSLEYDNTLSELAINALISRRDDIELMGFHYGQLVENYKRFNKIMSRGFWGDLWNAFSSSFVSTALLGVDISDIWDEMKQAKDEKFVELYGNALSGFIEYANNFTENTILAYEPVVWKFREKYIMFDMLFQKALDEASFSGNDINSTYNDWKQAQYNSDLKDINSVVVNRLKEKGLTNISENNLRSILKLN